MLRYRFDIMPDDNDTFLVTSPDFPFVTYGKTEDEARRNIGDAVESVMQSMMDAREVVLNPNFNTTIEPDLIAKEEAKWGVFTLRLQTELKVRLHNAMVEANMTRADLQRRLGWQRESVDRLFRLNHASKIEQLDDAMRAIGQRYDVQTVRDVSRAA